jgi:hypothetical protein
MKNEKDVKLDKHYVEWAAIWSAAAELSRRGCKVSFTFGNVSKKDLDCESPNGEQFKVQIKGTQGSAKDPNDPDPWIQPRFFTDPEDKNLFFIIVLVSSDCSKPFRFFIMSHKELKEKEYEGGTAWLGLKPGVVLPYENQWNKIP